MSDSKDLNNPEKEEDKNIAEVSENDTSENHTEAPESKSDDSESSEKPSDSSSESQDAETPDSSPDSTADEGNEGNDDDDVFAGADATGNDSSVIPGSIDAILADANTVRPDKVHIVPVYGRPFLPGLILPVQVASKPWRDTFEQVLKNKNKALGLFCITPENEEEKADIVNNEKELLNRIPKTGCLIRIIHARINDSEIQFIAEGICRIQISKFINSDKPPFLAEVVYPQASNESNASDEDIKAHAMSVVNTVREMLPLNHIYSDEIKQFTLKFSPNKPAELADGASAITTASGKELQEILDTMDIITRLKKCITLLLKEYEIAKLQNDIRNSVDEKIQKNQRSYFLREQLKVIQKELGMNEKEAFEFENKALQDFINKLEQRMASLKVPDHVRERYDEEISKLKLINPSSPEYEVVCSYLDWISQIPWGVEKEENLDIGHARKVLNEDHDAIDDVKDRIIEFIALGQKKGSTNGSIILLVGPPGVGKTSVGKSVARALDRPFYRFSVGGLHDESEIKGHRRTYIGAMPGKLIQAVKQSKCMNPVIMLDEIDKISNSIRGNPSAALLEALDPEQNTNFLDHYIDLNVDFSKCLFICTANTTETIPSALLDRMDKIELSGYLAQEKLSIAKHHLIPRLMKEANLTSKELKIPDAAVKLIIEDYAREAGVRHLEKLLAKIIRKVVVRLIENPPAEPVVISKDNIKDFLKSPLFRADDELKGVGIATGLAWTSMGGATIPIEVALINNSGASMKLTGSLGDVMKESAEIAYSFASARIGNYMPSKKHYFDKAKIHMHVPEGATPKDGPSAGITMATALISLAMNRAPAKGYAMTGELTLTGKVLAIGGIREKTMAARRLGIKKIICPKQNENDVKDLPDFVKEKMEYFFVETYDDVQKILFPERKTAARKNSENETAVQETE